MTITNKGPFVVGLAMGISFFAVLILIFSPVLRGKNGLDYADDLFNKLAKGSSYFIPNLLKSNEKFLGKPFRVAINIEKAQTIEPMAKLFTAAGAKVETKGGGLTIGGDFGRVLQNTLRDSDWMFKNDGPRVTALYGYEGREVLQNWWTALTKIDRTFKKNLQIEESKMVTEVTKKAIEPAYNFYQVEPQKVADRFGIMTLLLVFYVVYTLWWGYSIFYLFEGVGLTMKKARVKKEVG